MRSALGCSALGLLLLLVAGTFDAEPLYVTGSALVLLGIGAIAWIGVGGRGATVRREVERRSVVEEEPLHVRIAVSSGRFGLPPGWVEEPLLPEPVRIRAGHRSARFRVDVTFGRRGRRRLAPPALVLRDPLGLAQKTVVATTEDEVLVLPRIYPIASARAGGRDGHTGIRASLTAAAEVEIDGLKEHIEGSPASRIHWPTVARGRGMMERKLVAEADSRPIVVLDPRGAATPEALDAAVRAAASLTVHFARDAGCALLLPGDRRASTVEHDLAAWPPLHVRLALIDGSTGPALSAVGHRRGVVVLVSARLIDRAPRTIGRTPGGLILVVPGEIAGRRALFTVAGCNGYTASRAGSGAAAAAEAAVGV